MIDMEYNYYFPHCILVTKWFYNIIFRCVFLNSISYYSIVHFSVYIQESLKFTSHQLFAWLKMKIFI